MTWVSSRSHTQLAPKLGLSSPEAHALSDDTKQYSWYIKMMEELVTQATSPAYV